MNDDYSDAEMWMYVAMAEVILLIIASAHVGYPYAWWIMWPLLNAALALAFIGVLTISVVITVIQIVRADDE